MYIKCAATRRWFAVALLLAVAALAAPAAGSAKAQKSIVISISHQMLWAYKGDKVVLNSYVSTGRAGFDTPVGSFAVLTKLPSQTMEAVIGGEYYNVGNVTQLVRRMGRVSSQSASAAAIHHHSQSRQPARHAPVRPKR